jgi:hypothetical protein
VLTLNESIKDKEHLLEVIWNALSYFPKEMWEGVNYLGNMEVEYHLKIGSKEEPRGAFIVNTLMNKIREMRKQLEIEDLLLALTHDPVVMTFYRFEKTGFKRMVNLVRDYVNKKVGLVSLFEMDEETGSRIAAHGLGHHHGLTHHLDPIDLMYVRLLNGNSIRENGFCNECRDRLQIIEA